MKSLNQKLTQLIEEVNLLLAKENPFTSQEFIKLAIQVMNYGDLDTLISQ